MTREEAIQWLEDIRNLEVNWAHDVAIDMAIEALSEPSKVDYRTDKSADIGTEVNDLISRADAIEALHKSGLCYENWIEVRSEINALPTADRPNMIPIKLEKRYPQSKDEDITDAFMRGYMQGKSADRPTRLYEEAAIELLRMTGWLDEHDKEIGRPHGEWIDQHEDGHGWWVGRCDQCGKENRVGNFCPNCGAAMEANE